MIRRSWLPSPLHSMRGGGSTANDRCRRGSRLPRRRAIARKCDCCQTPMYSGNRKSTGQKKEAGMQEVRLEGLTLRVESVRRSIKFYGGKLGFSVEIDKAPHSAMIR